MTQPPLESPAMLSREEIAQLEAGHTAVSPTLAWFLVVVFLAAIVVAPLAEFALAERPEGDQASGTAWSILAALPREVSGQLSDMPPTGGHDTWTRIVTANRAVLAGLSSFESALEDGSTIGGRLRPPAQLAMSRWLGAGNERVYRGREGWLFYRPDVEYLTGRGFLTPAELERRVRSASEWTRPIEPDPRKAILRLKKDLDARGITLIVMPTPVKPTVHPAKLAGRFDERSAPPHNPSYAAFLDDLVREGVLVLDVSQALADAASGAAQYLATDTHWRPEAMEMAAEALGGMIAAHALLPDAPDPGHRVERVEVRAAGDSARMLDLPSGQIVYPAEAVWLRRVLEADGTPWQPSRDADVLVLGDSFSNIYSLPSMGWGGAAGFVEQVSYVLRRPIDRIVQNDDGAFATRAMLSQSGDDRLVGKRVVIYEFAARELAFGDWRLIDLGARP
ncbi:MAG: hypothetical protein A3H97_09965 [Acidobacteria bacterium RIFCSPLOWO2_02_FULL_65_29]|nr:MAG: hypothetical protein A3H97_09965 [Acidobacteria bacterium RIFCSPLOWO2_02_FULL_65_29]